MSNSLVPTGMPSQQDIQEMARLRAIMNGTSVPAVQEPIQAHYSGGNTGTQRRPMNETRAPVAPAAPYMPSFGTSRQEVDAMKDVMLKLKALSGDEAPQRPTERLLETTEYQAPALPAPSGSGPYEVLISLKESAQGKEVRSYDVVDSGRRDVVSGLSLQEAAQAVMKLLNKGYLLESDKVSEVLDLEETYNRNRIETGKHRARYQRSTELGETSAANIFKDRFNEAKALALVAQDGIKSILESIR